MQIKGKTINYDPKECAAEARALCEKMTGRKCDAVLAVLAYQDEKDEDGCKLLFSGEMDEGPGFADKMAKIYGVAILNIRSSADNMARAIAKQGGPGEEAEFRRKLDEFVRKHEQKCKDEAIASTIVSRDDGQQEELS